MKLLQHEQSCCECLLKLYLLALGCYEVLPPSLLDAAEGLRLDFRSKMLPGGPSE